MRIVVLASGAFAIPTIRRLAGGEHEIALVVTQPARGSGRGRHRTPTPVKALADELGLASVEIENVNTPEFVEQVRRLDARLMLAIAFGQKLGPQFLTAARGGAINLHASLLPKYRGAAPINWAIVRGERETGNTVFRIVGRMDAGPILAQHATAIAPDETAGELHDRLAELGAQTALDALAQFSTDIDPPGMPQDDALASLAPKLKKSDGFLDFSLPVRRVVDYIRGMTPWPGATAKYVAAAGHSEVVTLTRAKGNGGDTRPDAAPGTVNPEGRIVVGEGLLEIVRIKPASGHEMSWTDFVNGRHVHPGDRFEPP